MMFKLLHTLMLSAAFAYQNDPALHQLDTFKRCTKGPIGIMSTSGGAPVECREAESSLNTDLLTNEYLKESLTNVVRERIPQRVVHTHGTGAFGYFETTHDISHICKAKLFSKIGKRTSIAVRFSQNFSLKGAADLGREARGFSVKFYTEEGNFDFVGFSTPVFTFNEPLLFGPSIHCLARNPKTNLPDANTLWDFITLNHQSIFIFLYLLSDRGIPDGYDHMSGHAIHTYVVHNAEGETNFVRFHIFPDEGIKNLNTTQASTFAAADPDYLARKLYNRIDNGNFPSYTLSVQILSHNDVKNAGFDVFDISKILPFDDYPLHKVGKLIFDKNPTNHFAEIEQLAFCPANLVPGILGSPDQMFRARRLSYKDAHMYRLGTNANKIPVNCPMRGPALTYNRDGVSPVGDNGKDAPNYYPNSFNGIFPYKDKHRPSLFEIIENKTDNFKQASDYYYTLSLDERSRLVENVFLSIKTCEEFLKCRAIELFRKTNADLGKRVAKRLNVKC